MVEMKSLALILCERTPFVEDGVLKQALAHEGSSHRLLWRSSRMVAWMRLLGRLVRA